MIQRENRLGVALVGMGSYATNQLIPALQQTAHCYLSAIVTSQLSNSNSWNDNYDVSKKNIYSYDNFDSIKDNPDIDIVYITLPTHLHASYTVRALKAGKHVICEKPMALTLAECDEMIAAAEQANKLLFIGYRLQFDPYHHEMIRLVKEKVYGDIISIDTAFSFIPASGDWRLNKTFAGGGPLMDVGIYCIQAACYITGELPVAVTAQSLSTSDTQKFIGIEETVEFELEMPGGIMVNCRTSYAEEDGYLKVTGTNGWFELNPAYNFGGLKFNASDGRIFERPETSQQATQLDCMALAIQHNEPPKSSGDMGKRDILILAAIYKAMEIGERILLAF